MVANDSSSDLTPAQRYALHVIREDGPLTTASLADETGLAQRTVSAAITRLEEEGLIGTRPATSDARKTLVEPDD